MWNIVLSLCLLTGSGGTEKSIEAAIHKATTGGKLLWRKVLAASVKEGMTLQQAEAVLGGSGGEYITGFGTIMVYDYSGVVVWWKPKSTTKDAQLIVLKADSYSLAYIWEVMMRDEGEGR